ncbi:uncharacterized protein LOC133844138 [Drosophila sulfurigaster albostrigata]|uniref:uncharacterized protein LOC133844138 n=1 Tax=Drosophila sulfurigaster albostrigata TaxID=89887 RepID=UPI002D21DD77|nr:uncharacterized protein LOC133844138 [Drosophila sulfurigaster albostrigata]
MCSFWKTAGVVAFYISIVYNFLLFFVILTFVLRCYDDCDVDELPEGEAIDKDCFEAYALYTLYVPSLVAAPIFVLTDFRNVINLEWWLLFQALITCCSCLTFICYNSFYTFYNIIFNGLGVAALIISFIIVTNHLFKVRRTPAPDVTTNPESIQSVG